MDANKRKKRSSILRKWQKCRRQSVKEAGMDDATLPE